NVEAMAARGYRGFAVYPADASAANGLYEELVANGAMVVNFGAPTALPTPASFCVATDVKQAAGQAAEALIKFMGGRGNILNVLELVEDPNTILRRDGIEEVVKQHKGVTIIQTIAGMKSLGESMTRIEDALSARIQEIDGIICTGYTPTVAAATILSEWHRKPTNKRIHFVGIDTDEVVLKAIEAGHIDGTVAQNPFGHGYISCKLLCYLLDGWKPGEGAYFVDTGTVLVTRDSLKTYRDEVMAVTKRILAELETKYLVRPQ
ncbi:substrate-binding domain-containing protein, partial [Candidatus Sumerlaeota bacterium]|nr:substrate-binding domain-containing protein [Candidatus Sumerlaeota bacterium]